MALGDDEKAVQNGPGWANNHPVVDMIRDVPASAVVVELDESKTCVLGAWCIGITK